MTDWHYVLTAKFRGFFKKNYSLYFQNLRCMGII